MNNKYNPTKDYYNYVNNNYNQPVYMQPTAPKKYDPYNGFIRGNMFPELYNSYKINKPFEIAPMNEQAEMLTVLDSLGFATIDLNLYLDNYPNDREALNLFNDYRGQLNAYKEEYQQKFGPLLINSDSLNKYPWAWNNSPWPWERK